MRANIYTMVMNIKMHSGSGVQKVLRFFKLGLVVSLGFLVLFFVSPGRITKLFFGDVDSKGGFIDPAFADYVAGGTPPAEGTSPAPGAEGESCQGSGESCGEAG